MAQFKYTCNPNMKRHIEKVLNGEYRVNYMVPGVVNTVLDIGANIGAFTFWASQQFPVATIHAYEPNLKNCTLFRKHMNDSAIPSYRFNLHEVAVITAAAPTVTLFEGKFNCGMHSINKGLAGQSTETFEAATLSPFALPDAEFVKVDTEGCEVEILSAYLQRAFRPTFISYEYHHPDDRIKLDAMMEEKGYILCGGEIVFLNLGTLNFVHKSCFNLKP